VCKMFCYFSVDMHPTLPNVFVVRGEKNKYFVVNFVFCVLLMLFFLFNERIDARMLFVRSGWFSKVLWSGNHWWVSERINTIHERVYFVCVCDVGVYHGRLWRLIWIAWELWVIAWWWWWRWWWWWWLRQHVNIVRALCVHVADVFKLLWGPTGVDEGGDITLVISSYTNQTGYQFQRDITEQTLWRFSKNPNVSAPPVHCVVASLLLWLL